VGRFIFCSAPQYANSHRRGTVVGGRAIYGSSTKQKLNKRSSTEVELVGVNDALSQILQTRQLLSEKGFRDTDHVINQKQPKCNASEEPW